MISTRSQLFLVKINFPYALEKREIMFDRPLDWILFTAVKFFNVIVKGQQEKYRNVTATFFFYIWYWQQ